MTGLRQLSCSSSTRQPHRYRHHMPGFCRVHLLPAAQPRSPPGSPQLSSTAPQPPRTAAPGAPPPATAPSPAAPPCAPALVWSRRAALLALSLSAGALLPSGRVAGVSAARADPLPPAPLPLPVPLPARPLRSTGWFVPSELTVLNDLEGPLKVYWLNYDGDAELFGSLSPGSVFTVRTFESHAWRFVDANSGTIVAEHIMAAGQQVVRVVPNTAAGAAATASAPAGRQAASYTHTRASPEAAQQPMAPRGAAGGAAEGVASAQAQPQPVPPEEQQVVVAARRSSAGGGSFEGFDGLGNDEQQYTLAQLREIKIYPGGGNVVLSLPGAQQPLELELAGPEALSLVAATGSLEQRRPSTLGTWTRSLMASGVELRRVCITRVVDGVFYCRIVLSRPDSSLCSLDATPGDSLSLALRMGRPIYVAKEVARVHQSVMDVFARRRQAMEAAAASGFLDEAAEAAADLEAQDALDSIARALPSAPRPVRAVEMDRRLDA